MIMIINKTIEGCCLYFNNALYCKKLSSKNIKFKLFQADRRAELKLESAANQMTKCIFRKVKEYKKQIPL